jgi:uncharacterized protein (TIGR03118 family)
LTILKIEKMKKSSTLKQTLLIVAFLAGMLITGIISCKKSSTTTNTTTNYQQTNLVADTSTFGAGRIDTSLDNPWGIAIGPTGILWISVNHDGSSAVYDGAGNQVLAKVEIPLDTANDASPTGTVYNGTSSFVMPSNGQPAKFIFVTEDGVITAWNSGAATTLVADRSAADAVYKGVTIANDGSGNFIYATDFHNGKIDVFDQSFNYVANKTFTDPSMPAGFAPFNIATIGGQLYITYALQKGPDKEDDQAGAGNGYVDIYKPDGTFVKRFASQGTLNSPWGIASAPSSFGQGSDMILIGNFGDGRINVFDKNGSYKGQLMNNGAPITIDGLWALTFPQSTAGNLDLNTLYFTAGPSEETYGIFGYLRKK